MAGWILDEWIILITFSEWHQWLQTRWGRQFFRTGKGVPERLFFAWIGPGQWPTTWGKIPISFPHLHLTLFIYNQFCFCFQAFYRYFKGGFKRFIIKELLFEFGMTYEVLFCYLKGLNLSFKSPISPFHLTLIIYNRSIFSVYFKCLIIK